MIDKFKIKISILVPQNGEVGVSPEKGYRSISSPQVLYPGTVDTFSYLNIGFFDSEQEAINFRDYMTTFAETIIKKFHIEKRHPYIIMHMTYTIMQICGVVLLLCSWIGLILLGLLVFDYYFTYKNKQKK